MKDKSPENPAPGWTEGGVASEILEYLSQHPSAEDTLEGIVRWLTSEKRLATTPGIVAYALAQLAERGLVTTHPGAAGPPVYHRVSSIAKG